MLQNYPRNGSKSNRHKSDSVGFVVVYRNQRFSACVVEKIEEDTIKIYRNSHKTKSEKIPTLFITLFHKASSKFDSLRLIDSYIYVHNTHAKLKAPTLSDKLKSIFNKMKNMFAWRDAMIESIGHTYEETSDILSPDYTYDTFSVCSSL